MKSITQDMKFRYSLMKYCEKYGVSRASRKYNKSRSYIYFWKKRFDGTLESLACESRRPHHHPNQHTEEELRMIRNMHRRNPRIGIVDLWARLRERGYSRCVESLWRVMRREGMAEKEKPKKKYRPKPYEQMQYPGQRIQIDVKVVPRYCIADPQLTRLLTSIPATVYWAPIQNSPLTRQPTSCEKSSLPLLAKA